MGQNFSPRFVTYRYRRRIYWEKLHSKGASYMDDKKEPQTPDVDDLVFQDQDPVGASQR